MAFLTHRIDEEILTENKKKQTSHSNDNEMSFIINIGRKINQMEF